METKSKNLFFSNVLSQYFCIKHKVTADRFCKVKGISFLCLFTRGNNNNRQVDFKRITIISIVFSKYDVFIQKF